MRWDNKNPLLIGSRVHGKSSVADVKLKGFDKGKPMIFVTQRINFEMDGMDGKSSLVEDRTHVYFEVKEEEEGKKKPDPRRMYFDNLDCS